MVYEYLIKNYKENEPIFLSDMELPLSATNLRQQFKILCDSGKIKRYDTGVYYLPTTSRLKGAVPFSPNEIVNCKYIIRKDCVEGYYSGFTFANQMGLTQQVPYKIEITTNVASAKAREVDVSGQKVILRKPKTQITEENYRILQLLDLLKDIDSYSDESKEFVMDKLSSYIRKEKFQQTELDKYISMYPDRVYRNLYEMRLYNAFA